MKPYLGDNFMAPITPKAAFVALNATGKGYWKIRYPVTANNGSQFGQFGIIYSASLKLKFLR